LLVFGEPQAYAEGILKVCKRYVETPLVCVSGVSGAHLRTRIEAIVANRIGLRLNVARRVTLAAAGTAALGIPIVVGMVSIAPRVSAQSETAAKPQFEVASVKQNKSGALRVTMAPQPGGRFTATNAPLRALIRNAYQLQDQELVGGPSWLNTDRFDIVAKASDSAVSAGQTRSMLQTLLAERFKMIVHHETRELPVYALVMVRGDGKPGPQLHRTGADCASPDAPLPALDFGAGPRDPNAACGYIGPGTGSGATLTIRGVTMETLSRFLAPTVHRIVINRTGLAGYFDMDVEMTTELGPPPPPPGAPDRFDRSSAPSIFTVLQEKLGLKLESTRGPVEVLIIDRVERPTDD
jgi:bla regulator protein blaR1